MDKYITYKHHLIDKHIGIDGFMKKLHTKNPQLHDKIMKTHIKNLVGGGILDRIKGVLFGRYDYPPAERKLIEKYGNSKIIKIEVYREPLQKATKILSNALTLGKLEELKKKYSYDELYHLFLVVYVEYNGQIVPITVEKHEIINIHEFPKIQENAQKLDINLPSGFNENFRNFLKKAEQKMGSKYWFYNAFNNNCQIYVMNLLDASGLMQYNPNAKPFIYQDVSELTKEINPISRGLINLATGLKGRLNVLFKGYGKY